MPADRRAAAREHVPAAILELFEERLPAMAAELADGCSVTVIKDLKVKGSGGVTLKRGTLIKNIRLTDDPREIECNAEKVRGLVLKTEFVKRA